MWITFTTYINSCIRWHKVITILIIRKAVTKEDIAETAFYKPIEGWRSPEFLVPLSPFIDEVEIDMKLTKSGLRIPGETIPDNLK